MVFFVIEQDLEEVAGAVVFVFYGDADGVVIHLGGVDLEVEVALDHVLDGFTDGEFEGLHIGNAVEEEDALHQAFGVFHFADRLHLDVFGEAFVAPVFAHLSVKEILVDGGELFAKGFVELLEYFGVAFHGQQDEGNFARCKERKGNFARGGEEVRRLTTEFTEDAEKADQRRKWEMSQRIRVRPTLRAMEVVIGK